MVRRAIRVQLRQQIAADLLNSITVFRDYQREKEINLEQSAELLANLPNLKAIMTAPDALTIQDASAEIWRLSPSDVFVLAKPTGKVVAIHTTGPGITRSLAESLLADSLTKDQPSYWWYGDGHLYQVFLQPIYSGPVKNDVVLGVLCLGHEISSQFAMERSRVASSQVAFYYGSTLIVSTLQPAHEFELKHRYPNPEQLAGEEPKEVYLGDEQYLASTVTLLPSVPPLVHMSVLKSYDKAAVYLDNLNRLLLGLGVLAVLAGSVLVFLISTTFTRPLANLVAGVRALEKGDFTYPLPSQSTDEVAEVTKAFDKMRSNLSRTQKDLIEAERLATIGRMASSISHDMRHPLTAVMANAEFLSCTGLDSQQRDELYREIRNAVNQMTDLVDSLLEFAQGRESLHRVFGRLEDATERAVHMVRARAEFRDIKISIVRDGQCETWFDEKKVERVLVNVLFNACEAVNKQTGEVGVDLRESKSQIEIRIKDNGPGVSEAIRDKLFQPFISHGKQNGIGLGLAICQKILQEHGGDAQLECTRTGKTVFRLTLPLLASKDGEFWPNLGQFAAGEYSGENLDKSV
jgi:signal transduction histidine kinase